MSTLKNTKQLEPFSAAVKRHRARLKGTVKSKHGLELLSKFMARAEVERGHVAAPAKS